MRSSLQRTRPRPTQVFHPVPHLFARLASPGRLFLVHIKIDPSPWSMLPAGLFPRFRLFLRETDFIRLAALRVFALQPYRDRSVSQKLIGTGGNQTGVPGTYSYIYGILPYSTVHCLTLHYMTWQSPPHQSLPIPPLQSRRPSVLSHPFSSCTTVQTVSTTSGSKHAHGSRVPVLACCCVASETG